MLLIRRIEITNFVCFDRIEIEPSTSREKPLTVIRAENGSGKTTLLRAIRWGMYGEKGLPGNASHFSLHPAEWRPDADGIETRIAILFETDGSSRNHLEGKPTNTVYELRRSVTTVAKEPSRRGEPDFRRMSEEAQLLIEQPDGSWLPYEAGVDRVIEELLPLGFAGLLRDGRGRGGRLRRGKREQGYRTPGRHRQDLLRRRRATGTGRLQERDPTRAKDLRGVRTRCHEGGRQQRVEREAGRAGPVARKGGEARREAGEESP